MGSMRFWHIIILMFALLASGCLESIGAKVPVLYANVTVEGDANGTKMVIRSIEASTGEVPKLQAQVEQLPKNFPAVYVNIVQSMMPLAYQTGQDYVGPGVYRFTVGIKSEVNRSLPMAISAEAINRTQETVDIKFMPFNWSTEIQSKTFK